MLRPALIFTRRSSSAGSFTKVKNFVMLLIEFWVLANWRIERMVQPHFPKILQVKYRRKKQPRTTISIKSQHSKERKAAVSGDESNE